MPRLTDKVRKFKTKLYIDTLRKNGGDINKSAKQLNLHPHTLRKYIPDYEKEMAQNGSSTTSTDIKTLENLAFNSLRNLLERGSEKAVLKVLAWLNPQLEQAIRQTTHNVNVRVSRVEQEKKLQSGLKQFGIVEAESVELEDIPQAEIENSG